MFHEHHRQGGIVYKFSALSTRHLSLNKSQLSVSLANLKTFHGKFAGIVWGVKLRKCSYQIIFEEFILSKYHDLLNT